MDKLKEKLHKLIDAEKSVQMAAYMRNQFSFLGIQKGDLKANTKEFVRLEKNILDWEIVNSLWEEEYREYQYVAMEYINLRQKLLTESDFEKLYSLIINKSWWDTVDELSNYVGYLAYNAEYGKQILLKWSVDENLWVRRTAIIAHRRFKDITDTDLLKEIIINNLESKEFFINKAIGWALREYSKTDPDWVRNFINDNCEGLNSLSIREGSKYI